MNPTYLLTRIIILRQIQNVITARTYKKQVEHKNEYNYILQIILPDEIKFRKKMPKQAPFSNYNLNYESKSSEDK